MLSTSLFDILPDEILVTLLENFPLKDAAAFGSTCKRHFSIWNENKDRLARLSLRMELLSKLSDEARNYLLDQPDAVAIYAQYKQASQCFVDNPTLKQYETYVNSSSNHLGRLVYLFLLAKNQKLALSGTDQDPDDYLVHLLNLSKENLNPRFQLVLEKSFHPIYQTVQEVASLIPYHLFLCPLLLLPIPLLLGIISAVAAYSHLDPSTVFQTVALSCLSIALTLFSIVPSSIVASNIKNNWSRFNNPLMELENLATCIEESDCFEQITSNEITYLNNLSFIYHLAVKLDDFFSQLEATAIDLNQSDLYFACSMRPHNHLEIYLKDQYANRLFTQTFTFTLDNQRFACLNTQSQVSNLNEKIIGKYMAPLCQIILNKYLFDIRAPSIAIEARSENNEEESSLLQGHQS